MEKQMMRIVFGQTLAELGNENNNLAVLDADVSSSTQTIIFADLHPERFFNFGIAEANMVSAAAGMSTAGFIPVVSTFAFLLAFRTGDAVRSLIAYNNLNVKIAGGYAGLSDFADGASHQAVCDLAVMRALPNMTVLVPSDIETTRWAVRAMIEHNGPVYLRLSRDTVGNLHGRKFKFKIGKANVLREGEDICIAVCGTPLKAALDAADRLKKEGIGAAVVEFPTIKPFDKQTMIKYASKTGRVITVEEHSIIGGLGDAVADCLACEGNAKLRKIGIEDTFGESGNYNLLLEKHGICSENIINQAVNLLK